MKAYSRLDRFEKLANSASGVFYWVACGGIVALLLLTFVDLTAYKLSSVDWIGQNLFRWTWAGGYEITGLLGLVTISFAIALTQVLQGHVAVDFFVKRFTKRAQAVIAGIVSLFGLVLFALATWQMYDYGLILQATGRITPMEKIPLAPFAYAAAACALLMFFVLLVALLRSVKGVVGK